MKGLPVRREPLFPSRRDRTPELPGRTVPLRGRGKRGAPPALPLCSVWYVLAQSLNSWLLLIHTVAISLLRLCFRLDFSVCLILSVLIDFLLVSSLRYSSVMARARKTGRAMATFGSWPAWRSSRRAPLRQAAAYAPASLRRTRKRFRAIARV